MKTRILTLALPAVLSLCAIAATQNNNDNTLPSQITTRDGKTYNAVEKVRVDPDGILVNYQPGEGGYGLAKLKFRDLPDDLQKKYNYDEKKSADYENQQAQATGKWLRTRTADETAVIRYRNLAELNRSFAGEDAAAFSVDMDAHNVVMAHGVTQTAPSETITNVGFPSYIYHTSGSPVYPVNQTYPAAQPNPTGEALPEFESVP